MTWVEHARQIVRTPCTVVEIDLDYYEDASIVAVNDDDSLCYRTPATTYQSSATLTLTTKTRKFMTATQRPIPELGAIPCLRGAKIQAEEIRIGRGLGYFGQVTIELDDFVDDDRREDPFYSGVSRASVNHSAGTYFGKLLARNPYLTGRALRVVEGWATDGVWHTNDAITHNYFIRDVQGPTNGKIRITAAGPLQLLNLGEREAPAPSAGTLLADLNETDQVIELTDASYATDYAASGWLTIGDEVVAYTRVDGVFTITRGQFNTTATSHSAGDTLQIYLRYTAQPITDILSDILQTYGGVAEENLALDEWASEYETWLSLYSLTGGIARPTKILELVQELLETAASIMWWDDQRSLVRLRAIRPSQESRGTWGDKFHLLTPPDVRRDLAERVSRTDLLLDLRTGTLNTKEAASYRVRLVGDPLGEEAIKHGSAQLKLITTRWLSASQIALAARVSYQVTAQLVDGRQTIQVEVGAKDASRQIGDTFELYTRDIVTTEGEPKRIRVIVVRREPIVNGSKYRYLLERVPFNGRFAYMTDVDCPDYADAADYQRDPGAFMCAAPDLAFGIDDPPYVMG